MRGADDWGGSVPASRPLCLHVVLSVPQYHLFSSTTSQRRGTDNAAANAVFPASYGCKDLLPSVACYFSPFLTHIRHCCIFAPEKDPSPSLPSMGGSSYNRLSGHIGSTTTNGKVNQRSTPEGAEVKTENGKLTAHRSSAHLSPLTFNL